MIKTLSFLLMFAVAAPASAQNASPAQPTAPAAAKNKSGDRMICERQEEIGSRLGGKKVCKTAAQWELERQQNRQTIDQVQQQATANGHSG